VKLFLAIDAVSDFSHGASLFAKGREFKTALGTQASHSASHSQITITRQPSFLSAA
jgi:hypothetical protein